MARVYFRQDRKGGYYVLDIMTPAGKRVRQKLGPSKKLADQALADYELKRQRGELGFETKDIRVDDFWKQSIEYSKAINSEAQATRTEYVLLHFKEFLAQSYPGLKWLSQFAPDVFLAFQQIRLRSTGRKTKKPLKKKTVNLEIKAIKTMFNRAIEWGYLRENPCRVRSVKETDSKKIRSLTDQEARKLLDKTEDHWLHPVIRTMLYAGLRLGECAYLTWDDVDFEQQVVHIRRKEGWIPKSSGGEIRERDVYVGDELVAYLQRHKLASKHDDKLIFHDSHGKKLSKTTSIPFARITASLGFPDVTGVHSLRHTYITMLIRRGNDIATVQEQAGHRSILTTRRYIDVFEDAKRKAAQSLTYQVKESETEPRKGVVTGT